MDAIESLVAGSWRARAGVDAAARQLAQAARSNPPDPGAPGAATATPTRTHDVDVAGQLVTMTIAADVHHVTTAALRSAFSLYRDALELLRPEAPAGNSGPDS